MKVVLFCGGMGTRLRDYSEQIPKPLVEVGSRPIMWHLMKYYAHYGHKDFILCLGYGATAIKNYFLKYDPTYREFGGPKLFGDSLETPEAVWKYLPIAMVVGGYLMASRLPMPKVGMTKNKLVSILLLVLLVKRFGIRQNLAEPIAGVTIFALRTAALIGEWRLPHLK